MKYYSLTELTNIYHWNNAASFFMVHVPENTLPKATLYNHLKYKESMRRRLISPPCKEMLSENLEHQFSDIIITELQGMNKDHQLHWEVYTYCVKINEEKSQNNGMYHKDMREDYVSVKTTGTHHKCVAKNGLFIYGKRHIC